MTAGLASDLVQFEKLGTISLKGKAVRVEVYTPLGPATASVGVVWLHALEHAHLLPSVQARELAVRSSTEQSKTSREYKCWYTCHPQK